MDLRSRNLTGRIPSALGDLPHLKHWLSLSHNSLTGNIPSALGNLSKLERLELAGNRLSGSIPSQLGNLSNLKVLDLGGNRLTGNIPPELGNLSKLEALYISGNRLSGCIPTSLRDVEYNDFRETGLQFCDEIQSTTPTITPTPGGATHTPTRTSTPTITPTPGGATHTLPARPQPQRRLCQPRDAPTASPSPILPTNPIWCKRAPRCSKPRRYLPRNRPSTGRSTLL